MSNCIEEVHDAKEAGNNILTGRKLTVFISDDCVTSSPELSDLNSMRLWSHRFMGEDSGTA